MGAYLCGARSGDQLAVASGTTSERKKQEGTVNGTSPSALLKKLAIVFALMAIMTVSPPASDQCANRNILCRVRHREIKLFELFLI